LVWILKRARILSMNMMDYPLSALSTPARCGPPQDADAGLPTSCGRNAAYPGEQSLPAASSTLMGTRHPEPYRRIIGGNL
jgi:hypothetical protein